MANQPFFWGDNGQQITSPEQAARKRAVAEALIAQSATPGKNWAEGLADVAAALSGTVLEGRVSEAEAAGRERAGGLFSDLAVNQDPNAIIAALTSPDAAWASPAQTSIASALLNSGLERQDPMYQAKLAQLQAEAANGGGSPETFFGTPLYTEDAEGNVFVNQIGNQGTLNPLELPAGQTLASPTKEVDTGTEIITFDRFGNELFRTPKQLRQAAAETAGGTVEGRTAAESAALADSIESKMPGLEYVVDELRNLAQVATYTKTGQLIDAAMRETGQEPTEAAVARQKYISMVDNQILPLLRDTFGAQFTQKEGESLKATLGNPDASPAEKMAVLDAFIEQKRRDVAAMRGQPMPNSTSVEVIDWTDL